MVVSDSKRFIDEMKKGKIFIYPTDTIYGIGCNALNSKSVEKIRELKNREEKPFSVIAPNKKWIIENCETDNSVKKWIKKLPGKYTLILKLKNKKCICEKTNNDSGTLGIRIPQHWFSKLVEEANVPFVTTSVNLSGELPANSLENINKEIKDKVDYVIDEGRLENRPSTIVNLINGEIIKR